MDDLAALAGVLRAHGISLTLDLVLNHVAAEHEWARRARAGEARYRAYFHVFADRSVPDAYERTLPEVFPDFAPGSFTWDDGLAGLGVDDVQRLAVGPRTGTTPTSSRSSPRSSASSPTWASSACAWTPSRSCGSGMGTDCQNQPEVHALTRALRAVARIAAPALVFKAEAIVGPAAARALPRRRPPHRQGERPRLPQQPHGAGVVVARRARRAAGHGGAAPLPRQADDDRLGDLRPRPRRHRLGGRRRGRRRRRLGRLGAPARSCPTSTAAASRAASRAAWSSRRTPPPATGASAAARRRWPGSRRRARPTSGAVAVRRLLLAHTVVLGFGGIPLLWSGDELAALNDAPGPTTRRTPTTTAGCTARG